MEKMRLGVRIKPSSRGTMEKMLLGVYLDKRELEYLLNLEDGIIQNRSDVKRWENLRKIKAIRYKYRISKWFKVVKVPVLTRIGEDIVDEYRWTAETNSSINSLFITEDILGNQFWKSFKSASN